VSWRMYSRKSQCLRHERRLRAGHLDRCRFSLEQGLDPLTVGDSILDTQDAMEAARAGGPQRDSRDADQLESPEQTMLLNEPPKVISHKDSLSLRRWLRELPSCANPFTRIDKQIGL